MANQDFLVLAIMFVSSMMKLTFTVLSRGNEVDTSRPRYWSIANLVLHAEEGGCACAVTSLVEGNDTGIAFSKNWSSTASVGLDVLDGVRC